MVSILFEISMFSIPDWILLIFNITWSSSLSFLPTAKVFPSGFSFRRFRHSFFVLENGVNVNVGANVEHKRSCSIVWDYFEKLDIDGQSNCLLWKVITKHSSNTSNLLSMYKYLCITATSKTCRLISLNCWSYCWALKVKVCLTLHWILRLLFADLVSWKKWQVSVSKKVSIPWYRWKSTRYRIEIDIHSIAHH